MKLLAQVQLGTFNGLGGIGQTTAGSPQRIENIISIIVGVLTAFAGLWFVFHLVTGAITWISAGGDKQAIEKSQKKILNSIIGIFLVVASYALIRIVGYVLGYNILGFGDTLSALQP